jgi:phosphatidate phosphatase APP1
VTSGIPLPSVRRRLAGWLSRAEQTLDDRVADVLRRRRGWQLDVVPYVGSGTTTRAHLRARVVLRSSSDSSGDSFGAGVLATSLRRYLAVEVRGENVTIEVGGQRTQARSEWEGYVESRIDVELTPGWHDVTWTVAGSSTPGRLLVVDPRATLGLVSDIDDTVIHTGLTRAVRGGPQHAARRGAGPLPIPGAADLYSRLVAGDAGRAPVFYVSTGAWNLHEPMEQFLERHHFPPGRW